MQVRQRGLAKGASLAMRQLLTTSSSLVLKDRSLSNFLKFSLNEIMESFEWSVEQQ